MLGDRDVRAEPVPLHHRARVLPVVVQPGLADRPHPFQHRQLRDLGQHLLTLRRGGRGGRGLVGMHRDRRVEAGVLGRASRRPVRGRQVDADGDDPRDARRPRRGQYLGGRALDQVQVAVAVQGDTGQRLRRRHAGRGGQPVPRLAGSGHDRSSRANSSSMTDVSSLANSGSGRDSGTPGRTGTLSQRAGLE